jgi:hypothetical protein
VRGVQRCFFESERCRQSLSPTHLSVREIGEIQNGRE